MRGNNVLLSPGEEVTHRLGVPLPTSWRTDAASVQRIGDLVEGCCASSLYLADDRQHVGGLLVGKGFD